MLTPSDAEQALQAGLERAARNEATLRIALQLVTSPGLAPPYAARSRGARWRVAQAEQAIAEIRDAALASCTGGENGAA
jgi:hypothetical protein